MLTSLLIYENRALKHADSLLTAAGLLPFQFFKLEE
jgi:hypothetical protein